MADQGVEIVKLAHQAANELQAIADDPDAGEADRRNAFDRFEACMLLMGEHAIGEIEGRTGMLKDLIGELRGFTKSVRVKNPIAERIDTLLKITDKAEGLLKKEQKANKPG